MNAQLGKVVSQAAAGSAAARTASPALAGGPRENAAPPTQAQAATAPAQAQLSSEAAKQVARQINDFLNASSSNLQFLVDAESSKVLVRIVDVETNEVIRQIPSEEMLVLSRAMDQMPGLLIQDKV